MNPDHTQGTLLDGRIHYAQPRQGYRTGVEPVLMAAAVPARPGDHVLEAGCGAAAALLCLLWRIPGLIATGIEIDPETAALARHNLHANGHHATVHATDITLGVPGRYHHVLANPPWHNPAATPPPNARRARATHGDALPRWVRTLATALLPGGTLTLALPAAQAAAATALLQAQGLGRTTILPLLPKPGRPPKLALLQSRHGPPCLHDHSPLILHAPEGGYTSELEAMLREGAALTI